MAVHTLAVYKYVVFCVNLIRDLKYLEQHKLSFDIKIKVLKLD